MEGNVRKVLSGVGFYGTLAVCLAIVGVCGWLLLSGGEDGAVVAGARMGNADLAPGEVELRGPGGAMVRLCRDGTVRINGLVINEKGEIEP